MKRANNFDLEKYYNYLNFINECKHKEYEESLVLHKHHIIPKHMCVDENLTNSSDNLIKLSVDDHVKAHLMLADIYEKDTYEYISNLRSARILNKKSIKNKELLNKISKTYEGKNNPFYGKHHTKETIDKLRIASAKRKGMSYEDIYGESRARLEKQKRAKKTRTDREYKISAKKAAETLRKNKSNVGSKNPFAQPYLVDGKYFGCRKDVERFYKKAFVTIQKYQDVFKIPKQERELYKEKYDKSN